jgi:ubiquinone/menaquinone biosynthesis C-methylase UbiE/uncharacterized protein YbaR (Trm112 family)
MLSEKLMARLICPVCEGAPLDLVIEDADDDVILDANLGCPGCKRHYPVRNDIPVMMPPDLGSNLAASNERWQQWSAAMHRFLRWRDAAWTDPQAAAQRRSSAREMHEHFVEFCDLPSEPTDLLDVGCGTGQIADLLPESAWYVGLDPLPGGRSPAGEMPGDIPTPTRKVEFIQAVGEAVPVADDSFDAVLLMGTLDHARSPDEVVGETARVLRPGGTLGVLLGLAGSDDEGGIGGAFRSLVRSLTGQQNPRARDTHLHTFSSVEEVGEVLSERFELRETTEHANRAFVRATATGGDG